MTVDITFFYVFVLLLVLLQVEKSLIKVHALLFSGLGVLVLLISLTFMIGVSREGSSFTFRLPGEDVFRACMEVQRRIARLEEGCSSPAPFLLPYTKTHCIYSLAHVHHRGLNTVENTMYIQVI